MFCELLKPFLLIIRDNFYGIQLEIRKLEAKYTLPEYHKTRTDSKLFFKKIPLLMLTNQNKALFIVLTNQNKVLRIKIMSSSENSRKSVF